MKILFLTFYYPPDVCAGSFRAASFIKSLKKKIRPQDEIHIITTMPHRYDSYSEQYGKTKEYEKQGNITISRIKLPKHRSSFARLALLFVIFYLRVFHIVRNNKYDAVIATSSRLLTSFLGYKISRKFQISLHLDIRDIFIETMSDLKLNNLLLKTMIKPLLKILSSVEKKVINYASNLNLVSPGFNSYYRDKYKINTITNFTNGIDDIFYKYINNCPKEKSNKKNYRYKIIYAGNLGAGQALNKILPYIDKELLRYFEFIIIGDGSAKQSLIVELKKNNIYIDIISPMPREKLIDYYRLADILFIHLDDIDAFKRVLPSKIFEYAIFRIPIVAGAGGYFANFLKEELSYTFLFEPCNIQQFNTILRKIKNEGFKEEIEVSEFIKKYRLSSIMNEYAEYLIKIIQNKERNNQYK